MQDNSTIFLDSNIVIYTYCNNSANKQEKAKQLFADKTVAISTHVLQETANTLSRKFKADFNTIRSLLNGKILYSEDMQHNQIIEGKLKIINPFL